jgi:acetyl-CoA C-acetyltransferase
MSTSYVIAARRTPLGKLLGQLSMVPAPQLAAVAIRAAVAEAGLAAADVEEVILGNVLQAGVGQAPARQAALAAGLPDTIPALTINKVCGSGLKAVMLADQAIRAGDAQVIVAGGMENMSLAPHLMMNVRSGWKFGTQQVLDAMQQDGLWCATEQQAMGCLADATARQAGITREAQDAFALLSQQRAGQTIEQGLFQAEIAPVAVKTGKTEVIVERDEGPRPATTAADLARVRASFGTDGTATAGNASQISDGAAAVVVVSEKVLAEKVASHLHPPFRARIVATASTARAPKDLFLAPITAIRSVLAKTAWSLADIDLVELNEAFASQTLACIQALELPVEKVNVRGGAIALGHPIGCSGARVLTTLLHALHQRQTRRGIASLCLGGGGAVAVLVEMA